MQNCVLAMQDGIFEAGQAAAASLSGQFCTVYRVGPTSSGSVLQQRPIYTALPAEFVRTTDRKLLETNIFELIVFIGTVDARVLRFGDILVDNATGERYAYGQRRVLGVPLFARVETLVTIGQPYNPASSRAGRQPRQGAAFMTSYAAVKNGQYLPIKLAAGAYSVGALTDAAAQIPVGLQMKNNLGGPHDADLTDALLKANYVLYVPLGVPVTANSVLSVVGSTDQYVVLSATSGSEGFLGSVCIAQKVEV